MTDGTKHNHHTVPKFYLRGFSKKNDKNEKIIVLKLPGDTYTEQRIDTASVMRDYYIIDPEEFQSHDVKADDFENWLDEEFESHTGIVFQKINQDEWPLNPDDRATLAKFITLQYMRVPAHRDSINESKTLIAYADLASNGRENLRSGIRTYFGEDYTEESLDKIWSEIEDGTFRVESHSNTHLVTIMDELSDMAKFFMGRPWFLAKFSHRTLFTSDNPVVIVPNYEGVPTGLADAPEILFPLNRTTAIIMSNPYYLEMGNYDVQDIWDGRYDTIISQVNVNAILYKEIIDTIIHGAQKYLFCHPDDREKLPKGLPQPKRPRNFKDEAKQFRELGESMRNNKNLSYDDTPDDT